MLLLSAAKEEVEQAFGRNGAGYKRDGAGNDNSSDKRGVAPRLRKRLTRTQRLLHATQRNLGQGILP